jgi:hypothetical protein
MFIDRLLQGAGLKNTPEALDTTEPNHALLVLSTGSSAAPQRTHTHGGRTTTQENDEL